MHVFKSVLFCLYVFFLTHWHLTTFFSCTLLTRTPPLEKKTCHTFPYQEVAVGERSRGGRLLEEPKMMLFKANTFSLQVSIQDVPQLLWSIKPFTTCQVGTSCFLSFRVKSRTCVNCVCMFSVCHGHAQWRKLCTFISFPVFYLVTSKPEDSSKGTAGDHYGWLSRPHTHPYELNYDFQARHIHTHTPTLISCLSSLGSPCCMFCSPPWCLSHQWHPISRISLL